MKLFGSIFGEISQPPLKSNCNPRIKEGCGFSALKQDTHYIDSFTQSVIFLSFENQEKSERGQRG